MAKNFAKLVDIDVDGDRISPPKPVSAMSSMRECATEVATTMVATKKLQTTHKIALDNRSHDRSSRRDTLKSDPKKHESLDTGSLRQELKAAVVKVDVPAQDWFDEPNVPTSEEVGRIVAGAATGNPKPIHPNNIYGPWQSSEEYLKTLYGLFREDGLGPLRDCVDELRETPSLDEADSELKARIYESVYITGVTLCRKGLIFQVEFTTRRAGKRIHWHVSSRLKTGNAVALTTVKDGFKTVCKVAIVSARPLADLEVEAPKKPSVHIEFGNPNDIEIDPQQEWLMVEAPSSYWEATRHTLAALQSMRNEKLVNHSNEDVTLIETRFPLSRHVLDLDTQVSAPAYTDTTSILASAREENERLTAENSHGLDTSQEAALKRILTKSLAVVQGPPGTGKTYVSVVALRLLLSAVTGAEGPIIVTAHTNHALDQLLRHISAFEPEFVRLGGQSGDKEIIVPRTLPILREQQTKSRKGQRAEPLGIEKRVTPELEEMISVLGLETPMPLVAFEKAGLLTETQVAELSNLKNEWNQVFNNSDDPISTFCTDQITPYKRKGQDFNATLWEDIDETTDLQIEDADLAMGIEEDRWEELHGKYMPIDAGYTPRFERYSEAKIVSILEKHGNCLKDIPDKFRGSIYEYFRQKTLDATRDRLRTIGWDCKRMAQLFKVARWEADYHILTGIKIIGMTTTGLSKYRPLVRALRPKIVIVEEAAEVLEPSIAPAFMPSVEHVILVGDHQQLRGHCNLRELEGKPFHLDMSMFERLVKNQMEFTRLQSQRRMRPEIRETIAPIYPDLNDHASVLYRPNIPGMGGVNTCFVHHEFLEATDDQLSKLNNGEALFAVMFCKYLVENGINARRITVLTFYNGQRKLLLRLLARNGVVDCRVATVDSFQGEENDVVVLSLVRCNTQHQIGFLTVDNRVCVALSRARLGFYIFGHITDVYQRSELWRKVCQILEARQTLFAGLPLVCKNHGTTTWATSGEGLRKLDGGCKEECGGTMPCGHRCPLKCHPLSHEQLRCQEPCNARLPCGHPCRYLCWSQIHACEPCTEQRKEDARQTHKKILAEARETLDQNLVSIVPGSELTPAGKAHGVHQAAQTGSRQHQHQHQQQHQQQQIGRGRRAYQQFAANGSPPKAGGPSDVHNEQKQRQDNIENAAAKLATERALAAGSASAAMHALTTAVALRTLDAPDNSDETQLLQLQPRPRQVWTDTWVDPSVEVRARQLLQEAADRETKSSKQKQKQKEQQEQEPQLLVNLLN